MTNTIFKIRPAIFAMALIFSGLAIMGAGCATDPNVEGAKLDLRNKDYDRAIENLNKALETDPNNVAAHLWMGKAYQEMAGAISAIDSHTVLIDRMITSFDKVGELATAETPEMLQELEQRRSMAWYNEYNLGLAAYQRGSNDAAQFGVSTRFFNNAIRIEPDSSGTYVNLAYAHISDGASEKAIEPLKMAIEKGDRNPDTFNYLGDLLLNADENDQAVMTMEKAHEVFPDNADVTARMFNAYVRAGQQDRAIAVATAEVEKDPENKIFQYNLGSMKLSSEDYDGAIIHLTKATEIDPDYVNAYFNLGAAYQNKAVNVNTEIEELDEKLKEDTTNQELIDQVNALAERRDELFKMSVGPLEKARSGAEAAGDDTIGICSALMQGYARTGETEKAEEALKCSEGN